ncbi:MAG: YicC family protein [Terrimicrobiaceae bacterium]|nr:YicC family protein [Terrimicrobiaceae bacterium]
MTGYGRGEATSAGIRCVVECASVNRKGLEVACQLPRELSALEVVIRERVAHRVARGRVNVGVAVTIAGGGSAAEIDRALARDLLREIRSLQKELALAGDLDVNTLLALPGVIRTPQQTTADYEPIIARALDIALTALSTMRAKEGQSLHRDLTKRLAALRKARTRMAKLAPEIVVRYRNELRARVERTGVQLPVDDMRLATEIALFAERCDVSEELTRLDSHFAQIAEKLDMAGPVGRALEFLTQEIYRELNTLGSKAGDSALTRLVVDSKVELDKIREQVLNVE